MNRLTTCLLSDTDRTSFNKQGNEAIDLMIGKNSC